MEKKKCSKCGGIKDTSEFNKRNGTKDGLRYECNECRKQYRTANKEKIAACKKIYQKNNKKIIAFRKKRYYESNKEIILEKGRRYYLDNKESINKYSKQYYINNKEVIIESVKQYASKNKEKISKRMKLYRGTIAKYKYYYNKLTVDESPRLHNDGMSLEVLCKYCGNYFKPKSGSIITRIKALIGDTRGDNYLYCSENCKHACPIYRQVKYPKGLKKASSREVNSLIRQMCFKRDNWECQICGKNINKAQLHCHHIEGYTQNPLLGNDIDNVITLCKKCHKEVHKLPDCNYYELRCKAE